MINTLMPQVINLNDNAYVACLRFVVLVLALCVICAMFLYGQVALFCCLFLYVYLYSSLHDYVLCFMCVMCFMYFMPILYVFAFVF